MTEIQEKIYQLETSLLQNAVCLDVSKLKEILADDFLEIGSSGIVWRKADYLGNDGAGRRNVQVSNFNFADISADVALLTYELLDKESMLQTLRSSLWVKSKDRWRLRFHQATASIFQMKLEVLMFYGCCSCGNVSQQM